MTNLDLFQNTSNSQDIQNIIKNFSLFFSLSIRMNGKNINFEDKKINKSSFYKNKKLFKIESIDISTILVSKKESYVKKIFT